MRYARKANWRRMVIVTIPGVLLLASLAPGSPGHGVPAPDAGQLVVHEWGTFLSVQGSDGVTLGGMVDSEEVLPSFVEERGLASWQRSRIYSKMETPVTYFYTDRPRDVQVRVDMPRGVLTHWFPNVCEYGPNPSAKASAAVGGYLDWCSIHLIPLNHPEMRSAHPSATFKLKNGRVYSGLVESEDSVQVRLLTGPYTLQPLAKEQIIERQIQKLTVPALKPVGTEQTWRFTRETDSAVVRKTTYNTKREVEFQFEKFLFYRGLGTFPPPLEVRAGQNRERGVQLTLHNQSDLPLRAAFVIRVQDQTIQWAALEDLAPQRRHNVAANSLFKSPLPLDAGVPQAKEALAEALVALGLYSKEANAMVNTWEQSYFRTDGLRVLYALPRQTVDELIPLHINPAPDKLVRVMLGRLEVLTPDRERQIEKFVADLGARESATRAAASAGLARLGRLGEPALRRVVAYSKDSEVVARARSLLEKLTVR